MDLTPYFTETIKTAGKIEAARIVQYKSGCRKMEIKFYDGVPSVERHIMIIAIGENLLNQCVELDEIEPENIGFLQFMDGIQISEWVDK